MIFAILGNNSRTDSESSPRIVTALTVGAAVIFTVHALGIEPHSAFGSSSGIPIDDSETDSLITSRLFPLMSMVLIVLLAVVALIANRVEHARDAAEKAKTEAEKVSDKGEVLALVSRLLERMQTAKYESENLRNRAEKLWNEAKRTSNEENQNTADILRRSAMVLEQMADFFSSLHQWILDPHLISTNNLPERIIIFENTYELLLEKLSDRNNMTEAVLNHRGALRVHHCEPAVYLLGRLLQSIRAPHFSANFSPQELDKISNILRDVRKKLGEL